MPDEKSWRELANEWHASAMEDFALVQLGAASQMVSDGILGFHAQQTIEKALKALLADKMIEPRRTHDLRFLADRVRDLYDLPADPLAGGDLTPWATTRRYPGASPPAQPLNRAAVLNQVESCIELAERLLKRPKSY